MRETSHDNHFVSQGYLRNWASDDKSIYSYRVLVSHVDVPEWTLRSIATTAFQRDLYTTVAASGKESDSLERWLAREIEDPALEAIGRAISGKRLHPIDWHHMAMFFAAQDLRTPTRFIESMGGWKNELPELIQKSLEDAVRRLGEATRSGLPLEVPPPAEEPEPGPQVQVEVKPSKTEGTREIHAYITAGRALWVHEIKRLLTGQARRLTEHKWSIARPAVGHSWLTSDHPALKLNYHEDGNYNLGGGWGSRGTELILPISPKHLLYAQVGHRHSPRFPFTEDQTMKVNRFLAERAHRMIFAWEPLAAVSQWRPRIADRVAYDHEQQLWRDWHAEQSASEMESVADDV